MEDRFHLCVLVSVLYPYWSTWYLLNNVFFSQKFSFERFNMNLLGISLWCSKQSHVLYISFEFLIQVQNHTKSEVGLSLFSPILSHALKHRAELKDWNSLTKRVLWLIQGEHKKDKLGTSLADQWLRLVMQYYVNARSTGLISGQLTIPHAMLWGQKKIKISK